MTFNDQVQILEQTVNQLTQLLEQENESIQKHDFKNVVELRPKKQAMSDRISETVPALTQSAEWKELGPEDVTRLKNIINKAREKLEENQKIIEISSIAHDRVVSVIREAVRSQESPSTRYSDKGTLGEAASEKVSIILNETV